MKLTAFLLESIELICDPNELADLLRSCIDTCFGNDDKTLLFDCISKCQASQAENEAKCDSQKGKLFHKRTL